MAFYPIPFGHAEVRIDRRNPRPPRLGDKPTRPRKHRR
jgi:hypothetical protein